MRHPFHVGSLLVLALLAAPNRAQADHPRIIVWSSGVTNDLSPWVSFDCTVGTPRNSVLSRLTVNAEPSGNLDHFVARLQATCSDGSSRLMYSADRYSANITGATEDWGQLLALVLDPSRNYVKNVAMHKYGLSGHRWALLPEPYMPGRLVVLQCPDMLPPLYGSAPAGIKLRYDTNNGKIRDVALLCRS